MIGRDDFGLPVRKSSQQRPTNPFDIETFAPSPISSLPIDESCLDTSDVLEITELNIDVEQNTFDSENVQYRPSSERELSRNSFKAKLLKAERSMLKQGYGQDVVAVDAEDDNAVVRFLLSNKGILKLNS